MPSDKTTMARATDYPTSGSSIPSIVHKAARRQVRLKSRSAKTKPMGLTTATDFRQRSKARWIALACLMSHFDKVFALHSPHQRPHGLFPYRSSTTRRMVLTTPESIIEQASTQKLLDDLIDESVRTSAKRPIMMQFDPSSGWIWKRWKGTIFSETWDSCLSKMVYAMAVYMCCKAYPGIKPYLEGFNTLWGQLLSITTFTLTFFVNQSYALWRKCYELSRRLQGRLHDLNMSLACHAQRRPPSSPNEASSYTPGARQVLELVSRYIRLFNLLTYASFTRSHRPILTPRGMRRLVERGLMTSQERQILVDAELPATQRHNAVLLWIVRTYVEGREAGHFLGGAGFEDQFLEKVHVTRAQYGAIGDELQGRMPLAYAHIVQVLVDLILYMYPFMAFSAGMSPLVSVLGMGLLTVSYQGLFDLAKQFLDPYDNESYGRGEDPLVVDTLIAETNAGSMRWMHGLEQMPVSAQKIKDGELSEYLLPVRGFSLDELAQMEEERLEKERDVQERRAREESARKRLKEREQRVREAGEAMIPALFTAPGDKVKDARSTLVFANGDHTPRMQVPGLLSASAAISKAEGVVELVNTIVTHAPGMAASIVPDGTALEVPPLLEIHSNKKERVPAPNGADEDGNCSDADADANDEIRVDNFSHDNIDWETGDGYTHTFDAFDPYVDLPWHDQVGPDGQEIRLSQQLADEVWGEEVLAETEKKGRVKTYDEYLKRVAETKDIEENELRETELIMSAEPFAEYAPAHNDGKMVPKYDQTHLDPISQLWGSPPGDISDVSSYEDPPPPDDESFFGVSQLWGESLQTLTNEEGYGAADESDLFEGVSQFWGDDIDDKSSSATRVISPNAHTGSGSKSLFTRDVNYDFVLDSSDLRMSQILADEVWEEGHVELPPLESERPASLDDYSYNKQISDILEAEREEKRQTEAILKAPPGADYIEEPIETEQPVPSKEIDDLIVLGMDLPNVTDASIGSMNDITSTNNVETSIPRESERNLFLEDFTPVNGDDGIEIETLLGDCESSNGEKEADGDGKKGGLIDL